MYLWVGIPKTDLVGISPNDLIQWEAIKWAQTNGLEYYEEMDAGDDPRLRSFQIKIQSGTGYLVFCNKIFFVCLQNRREIISIIPQMKSFEIHSHDLIV